MDILVIEELGVKPSSVQIANKIIWVEGKYDAFYIRLLLNKKNFYESKRKYIEEYEIKYPCWWRCQIIQYLGKPKKLFLMCVRMHFIPGIRFIAYLHSLMIKKGA